MYLLVSLCSSPDSTHLIVLYNKLLKCVITVSLLFLSFFVFSPPRSQNTSSFPVEFWWTAVVRSTEEADAMLDPCRAILHWSRLCIWARYELETATTTVIVLRCPEDQKETIKSTFGGRKGVLLQQNPMNIHTFFLEGIILRSADFLEVFWRPLYAWVSGPRSRPVMGVRMYLLTMPAS